MKLRSRLLGIDASLRVVERMLGKEIASWTANERMEHHWQKPKSGAKQTNRYSMTVHELGPTLQRAVPAR